MSARPSPLGFGLYFIDVLACLLLCLSLALVGARFGREVTVPVDLPSLPSGAAAGGDLSGASIVLRSGDDGAELLYDGEPLGIEELERRLETAPPASVVVLSEASLLARVVGAAHAAGVHDIRLAYDGAAGAREGEPCCD